MAILKYLADDGTYKIVESFSNLKSSELIKTYSIDGKIISLKNDAGNVIVAIDLTNVIPEEDTRIPDTTAADIGKFLKVGETGDYILGEVNLNDATQEVSGFMSAADKIKVDSIPTPAAADEGKILYATSTGAYQLDDIPTYADATQEISGLMSAADKITFDAIPATYQRKITYGTEDLVAGESPLADGEIYIVYEP